MTSYQNYRNYLTKSIIGSRNENRKRFKDVCDTAGTELVETAFAGNRKYLLQLLTKGVDVDYRRPMGATALHWAVLNRHFDCAMMLILHGSDIHLRTFAGVSAIHAAAQGGNIDCVQLLINLGCDIHARGNSSATVLHDAVYGGHIDCVRLLINIGCDIHARDDKGWTLLHYAAKAGRTQCAQLVHSLGVGSCVMDRHLKTAYDIAMQYGQTETAALLKSMSNRIVTLTRRHMYKETGYSQAMGHDHGSSRYLSSHKENYIFDNTVSQKRRSAIEHEIKSMTASKKENAK